MLIAQDSEEGLFPKMKTVILFVLRTPAVRVQAIVMSGISGAAQDTSRGSINRRTPHRPPESSYQNRYQVRSTWCCGMEKSRTICHRESATVPNFFRA
jgi:hypothetical protein